MRFVHLLIEAVYILCPVVIFARAVALKFRKRRPMSMPLRKFQLTSLAGMSAGVLVSVTFALSVHGKLLLSQILLAGYFATSLILILQLLDRWSWDLCKSLLRVAHPQRPSVSFNIRALAALLMRTALIICVGLPYVLATMMTYRPRASAIDNPQSLFKWNYEQVSFNSTDGIPLSAWWIPAPHGESMSTVILCPGGDKASQLSLVKRLRPAGYNVLVFDFRGNGDSGGQLCSYGDLERRDVLGAMRWLRQAHPRACRKVTGIGVSIGGAALIAAAADPSPEGQNIDAIAVYETYDRLDREVGVMVDQFVPLPFSWFVKHVGLPLAGVQVGADLTSFAPAEQIKAIWPRPVLVIHGIEDEIVPFSQGESLYDSALQPKENFWIKDCSHAKSISSDAAARAVRECFDTAHRVI
jgi:fermentation-respiration switch protein FrsA (DUF1100 family)